MIARVAIGLAMATAAMAAAVAVAAPGSAAPGTGTASATGTGAKSGSPSAHGGLVDDLDCSACHTPAGWALGATAGGGFDHDRTGFGLRGAHAQQPCSGCHQGQGKPATTCEGCHRDPHERRVEGACVECHTATAWSDTDALARHRRTRMPLTGRHAMIDCVACHTRGERTWTGLPTDCYGCHAAAYRDRATHPDHDGDPTDPLQPIFPRTCGGCHRPSGWKPAIFDPTILPSRAARVAAGDHDRFFTLSTGPHQGAACASCHSDRRRVRTVRCDGCHATDALRGQHPSRALTSRRAASCLACHPRGRAR